MKLVMTLSNPFVTDPRPYKEAKFLVKSGFEVVAIAWDRKRKYKKEEVIDEIKIKRIWTKANYGFSFRFLLKIPIFWIKSFFKIIREKPKIVYTHDFDTAIIGFLMKLFFKKKWIYDSHDMYFTYFTKEGLLSKAIKKIDIFFAKHCDRLIVPTESIGGRFNGLKEFYIENGVKKEKILTIWNVPDLEEFLNYPKLKLKKSKKFTIGFIGGQRNIKNFLVLFEAIKDKPKEYKILFVGKGKDTQKLKKIAKERYPNLDIEFVGNVEYKLIPNYYKVCDCIFSYYPESENLHRAISVKLFEATALGIPGIVNKNSLMNDFIKKYKCGVAVKDLTAKDLKIALEKVKKIKFNPEKIRKEWNWKNEENKLVKVLKELNK